MRLLICFLACFLILLVAPVLARPAELPLVVMTPASDRSPAAVAVESARAALAGAVSHVAGEARDTVQAVVPAPASAAQHRVSPAAVDHIIRWEVTSESWYTRRLQHPVWPGGASGITWGIGYDGGHQGALAIQRDWHLHPAVTRLARTAGRTGVQAQAVLPQFRDIATPFPLARQVFEDASLPVYARATVRAYGDHALQLPADAFGALVGNTYNRGSSMVGDRNREKRLIRDRCLPAQNLGCIAAQLRSQCRLWEGTTLAAGLCARRHDEARLVEGAR